MQTLKGQLPSLFQLPPTELTGSSKTITPSLIPSSFLKEIGDDLSKKSEVTPLEKRISVIDISSTVKKDTVNNYLPSRFNHEMGDDYISKIKTQQIKCILDVTSAPNEFSHRYNISNNFLLVAEILKYFQTLAEDPIELAEHVQEEENYLIKAKLEIEQAKKINPLHPFYYYTLALFEEYQKIDCRNPEKIKKYIKPLLIAQALDPTCVEINTTLGKAVAGLEELWKELEREGTIDKATHQTWIANLKKCLKEDHLKDLFVEDPKLFQCATHTKHAAFFEAHPEFKSVAAFLKKYPAEGYMDIDELTPKNLQETLARGKDHPLLTELLLIQIEASSIPILTPEMAAIIKDAMIDYFKGGKTLKVDVSTEKELALIINNFRADPSLRESGEHTVEKFAHGGSPEKTARISYRIFISPDHPF